MSFLFNKKVCLLLFTAPIVTLYAPPVFAAPPQFAGKLSTKRSEFNDFIRRNANKEVYLSIVFDPVSRSEDKKKVEEPNDIGDPHPKPPSFTVDDHFYILDNSGNTEQWKKQTRYDATARQLRGTFMVTFDETFKDYAGVKSHIYRLRFLPNRPNPVVPNRAASSAAEQVPDEFRVVPGERMGRVFLGDSQEAIHRRLGPPAGPAYRISENLTAEAWPANAGTAATRGLVVIYRNNNAVQIEATTTAFRTSGGLNFSSSSEAWSRAYGRRESVILYKFPNNAKRPVGYEDWMKKGFAYKYEFLPVPKGADENGDSPIKAVSLIVHRRGERVIPDKNAEWNGGSYPTDQPPS